MHPSKSCQDPWEGGCLVLDLSRATLPGLPQGLGGGGAINGDCSPGRFYLDFYLLQKDKCRSSGGCTSPGWCLPC